MASLVGERVKDRYLIKSHLSQQRGRRTLLAEDRLTGKSVVLKLVLFGPDFAWEDLKLFEREAQTLKSLDLAAIPRYLDSFEVDTEMGKGFVLVQTYIEARSLQAQISAGRRFSESDIQEIARSILIILHYLHNRHPAVIHRDIKPSNILLAEGADRSSGNSLGNSLGKVYLIDFGSVQTAKSSSTLTVVGTYGYMPPEQFGGRAVPASDLYSLGATLIYLATGQHPADLTQDDMQIEFEPYSHLSTTFTRWIRRLTYPDMARRIRTVASAQESLARLQSSAVQHAAVFTARSPATPNSSLSRPYSSKVSAVPALPLKPILSDFKISIIDGALEIRCLSSRIREYAATTESNQRLAQKVTAPFALSALAFAGFWVALGFAILTDIAALAVIMLAAIVFFGFWFPMLSAKKSHQHTILKLSASASGVTTLQTQTVSAQSQLLPGDRENESPQTRDSKTDEIEVRSLYANAHFAATPHLSIALSPSDAFSLSRIEILGTQREIQWLCDRIHQWGRAPLS